MYYVKPYESIFCFDHWQSYVHMNNTSNTVKYTYLNASFKLLHFGVEIFGEIGLLVILSDTWLVFVVISEVYEIHGLYMASVLSIVHFVHIFNCA